MDLIVWFLCSTLLIYFELLTALKWTSSCCMCVKYDITKDHVLGGTRSIH